jgi:hypothetical protein
MITRKPGFDRVTGANRHFHHLGFEATYPVQRPG